MSPHVLVFAATALLQADPVSRAVWKDHASKEGGYTLAFPGAPSPLNEEIDAPSGKVPLRGAILNADDAIYAIYYNDNPALAKNAQGAYLDRMRDGAVSTKRGKLITERKFLFEGNPARELLIEARDPDDPDVLASHRVRMILVDRRLYQLMAVTLKDRREANLKDFEAFFKSFKLSAERPRPTVDEAPKAAWPTFTSVEGGFSILMPEKPKESKQSVETGVGAVDIVIVQAATSEMGYIVSFNDATAAAARQPKVLLDGTRDLAVKSSKGKLLSERKISLGRYSGREFRAEVPLNGEGKGALLRCRIYLVRHRVYQIIAIGPKDQAIADEVETFFKSFRLLK